MHLKDKIEARALGPRQNTVRGKREKADLEFSDLGMQAESDLTMR